MVCGLRTRGESKTWKGLKLSAMLSQINNLLTLIIIQVDEFILHSEFIDEQREQF